MTFQAEKIIILKAGKHPQHKPTILGKFLFSFSLFLLAILLHSNNINHEFAGDDDIVTRKNSFVQEGLSGIPMIFTKGLLYEVKNNINTKQR